MAKRDKAALHRGLVASLTETRDRLVAAQRLSQEGVTHEDARAEGDKDMRATEASYVARGQAMRVEALESDLARVVAMKVRKFKPEDPIALSAVVLIASDTDKRVVFVAPAGGGVRLEDAQGVVHVVTPASPLGKALLGSRAGDYVTFAKGGASEEAEIVEIE
jgi:transcription elongation GreA/GreB family factor